VAVDAVVVGGGCTGTSVAYHLAARGLKVTLCERNQIGSGITARSTSIVRQHYSIPELVTMSRYSLEVFRHFREIIGEDAGFVSTGYAVLVGKQDEATLETNVAMQRRAGVNTSVVRGNELEEILPTARVDDVAAAAFEPDAGYADPVRTSMAFAKRAADLGATIQVETPVRSVRAENGRVIGVDTDRGPIAAPVVVVAASVWGPQLLAPFGRTLQMEWKREVACFYRRPWDFGEPHIAGVDLVLGGHWRPDTGNVTVRGAESFPPETINVEHPDRYLRIASEMEVELGHEALTRRFPGMLRATRMGGHACVDDVTPDWQPYLGPIPECDGVYCAFGMSSHYFKHCPAIGLLMSELITEGKTTLVDISIFRPIRMEDGTPLRSPNPYVGGSPSL
jgi:sarcosine oxidase subunit beta